MPKDTVGTTPPQAETAKPKTVKQRQKRKEKSNKPAVIKREGKPDLIRTKNGGYLYAGGVPGNKGGSKPPSVLREKLRGSMEERIAVLEEIADGKVTVELNLSQKCEHCGQEPTEKLDQKALLSKLKRAVPSNEDRLRAIDMMGKYGLGAMKEVSVEQVRSRLAETIRRIMHVLDPEAHPNLTPGIHDTLASEVLSAIKPIWSE